MSKSLEERDRLCKVVLTVLARRPVRYTNLHKRTLRQYGTPAKFTRIFNYLKDKGYIQKQSTEYTAPYMITEKGRKLLEAL